MKKMNARSIKEKIDIFFRYICEDSSGQLKWHDVYTLSKIALQQAGVDNEQFVDSFANFFAKLIFNVRHYFAYLCRRPMLVRQNLFLWKRSKMLSKIQGKMLSY